MTKTGKELAHDVHFLLPGIWLHISVKGIPQIPFNRFGLQLFRNSVQNNPQTTVSAIVGVVVSCNDVSTLASLFLLENFLGLACGFGAGKKSAMYDTLFYVVVVIIGNHV